jgi:hypothetical protein
MQLFTLAQAQRALPEVDKALREALFFKDEYQKAESEVRSFTERIMMMGGTQVNHTRISTLKTRMDQSKAGLQRKIEDVQSIGCVIKDLEVGLIDFPTLYKEQEVYLCWKFGEPAIEYWHGVDEGFRGRKKIDQEFLNNHRGDVS